MLNAELIVHNHMISNHYNEQFLNYTKNSDLIQPHYTSTQIYIQLTLCATDAILNHINAHLLTQNTDLQETQGFPLSLPARRLAVQPQKRSVLTHHHLSDLNCRKKKSFRCAWQIRISSIDARVRTINAAAPLAWPYIMSGDLCVK